MPKQIKISTHIGALTRLGTPEYAVDAIKNAGFSSYDFTMMGPILGFELFYNSDDYLSKAKRFREYTDKIGIYCNQTHGFTPCLYKGMNKQEANRLFENVKRTIEITRVLGGKYCVLHPSSECTMEDNVKVFSSLKEIAHHNNVVIAIENMPSGVLFGKPEDFITLLDAINDDHFKMCLDIGHAELAMTGSSAIDFIRKMKDQIVCLHIHDNDQRYDLHQLPYSMQINFEEILKELKKQNYQGDITFETIAYSENMPVSLVSASLSFLYNLGEYMRKKIKKSFLND